ELLVRGVAGVPGGDRLVSASGDATLRLWDPSGANVPLRRRAHSSWGAGVAFSPRGGWLGSGSGGRPGRPPRPLREQPRGLTGHQERVWSVAFSPDSRRLASGSRDRTIRIWDVADGRELLCLRGHAAGVRGVAFAPDGRRLASGSDDRTARLWDLDAGLELL